MMVNNIGLTCQLNDIRPPDFRSNDVVSFNRVGGTKLLDVVVFVVAEVADAVDDGAPVPPGVNVIKLHILVVAKTRDRVS